MRVLGRGLLEGRRSQRELGADGVLTVVVDGVHDVGGMLGFGPVEREPSEAVFHHPWEGRVFGMAAGSMMAGVFGTPSFRHAIERMDAVHYLTSSYFEHWLTGLATLLAVVDIGWVS